MPQVKSKVKMRNSKLQVISKKTKTILPLRGMYQNGTSRGAKATRQSTMGDRHVEFTLSDSERARDDSKLKATRKPAGLLVPVYSLSGRSLGTMSLPKEIFGAKVNKNLLAQALRVYMTNQKNFTAKTKTRGEVRGSTAKVWRQKGTGRARHGARTAPIFVGGGVAFGPKPRSAKLKLPKKMRKAALLSALSIKAADKEILGLSGLEKATGKTKEMVKLLESLSLKFKARNSKLGSTLIVTDEKQDNVVRASRNIPGVNVLPASQINALEVLRHQILLLTKGAIDRLSKEEEV